MNQILFDEFMGEIRNLACPLNTPGFERGSTLFSSSPDEQG